MLRRINFLHPLTTTSSLRRKRRIVLDSATSISPKYPSTKILEKTKILLGRPIGGAVPMAAERVAPPANAASMTIVYDLDLKLFLAILTRHHPLRRRSTAPGRPLRLPRKRPGVTPTLRRPPGVTRPPPPLSTCQSRAVRKAPEAEPPALPRGKLGEALLLVAFSTYTPHTGLYIGVFVERETFLPSYISVPLVWRSLYGLTSILCFFFINIANVWYF